MFNEPTPSESGKDLFVSYAREDLDVVRPLVARLVRDGYSVWFDERDMSATGTVANNLATALDACAQTLVCISDSYCNKDFTIYELQLNFHRDPANKSNRTIPVVVRRPLESAIPVEIMTIPWVDLTIHGRYDSEYRRIVQAIIAKRPAAKFASPSEVNALRRLPDPDNILIQMKRFVKDMCMFVLQQENRGPLPGGSTQPIAQLLESRHLPPEIRFHVDTIQRYADLIDQKRVQREALEPALGALLQLSRWVTEKYHVEHAPSGPQDPFEMFWLRISEDWGQGDGARLPGSHYELSEGRRQLTSAGALYHARHAEDQILADLLLLPLDQTHRAEFTAELDYCQSLGERCPLPIQQRGKFDFPDVGEWGYLLLARPVRCGFESLCTRFKPLPKRVGLALARQTFRAFESLAKGAPALTHSLFRFEYLILDRTGAVRVVCDWEHGQDEESTVRARDEYWFCRRASGDSPANEAVWFRVRDALVEELRKSTASHEIFDAVANAANAAEAAAMLIPVGQQQAEDADIVRVAVESWLEHKDLPQWLTLPEGSPTTSSKRGSHSEVMDANPAPAGLRLAVKMPIDCLSAWPLGDSSLLVWQSDQHLGIIESGGGFRWRDEQAMRVRCVTVAAKGRLAVGGWGGELRWFDASGLVGSTSAAWTIGDIQSFGEGWLAGSWNGRLYLLDADGGVKSIQPAPEDGVCRIAVSKGEQFATLSMRGVASIYQGSAQRMSRDAQTAPIPRSLYLAFASGVLVVLTEEGLVIVERNGKSSRPDRLPARGGLRLIAFPPEEKCLLLNELGQSWVIDRTGTYPRGPVLAPRIEAVGFGFHSCISHLEMGGYAYWKHGLKIRSWTEALAASISSDGHRLAVVLPGAVEVYEATR